MNITTRTLLAIPIAGAALSASAGPVMADVMNLVPAQFAGLDDKDGPNPDPGPDGPDDKDGPNNDPGPDGPDELDGPNPDNDDDDGDNDDGDNDDGDNDDGDSNDGDSNDGDKGKYDTVVRPTRVDAGAGSDRPAEGDLSFGWVLASGAVVTAAGGFTARRAALKRL